MGVTISTHNGTAANREHNKRNRKVTDKEAHINPDGVHENWIDEGVRAAYSRLFGEAVKKYNEKQKRPERRIKDYYRTVCENKKQHPVYEMIVGIYGKDENGQPLCTVEQGKAILRQFVDDWKERNPNLELIGAYYHADEQGEPHVHLDYVPVAHGYKRGLDTQTGLVKALGEQGFTKDGKATAQIQWEARENEYLTELCERAGLEVDHPKRGYKHEDTKEYKEKQKQLAKLDKEIEQKQAQKATLNDEIKQLEQERDKSRDKAWAAWKDQKMDAYDVFETKLWGVFRDMDAIFNKNPVSFAMNKDYLKSYFDRVQDLVKKGGNIAQRSEHFAFETQEEYMRLSETADNMKEEIQRLRKRISTLEQSDRDFKKERVAVEKLGLAEIVAKQIERQDRQAQEQAAQQAALRQQWHRGGQSR